MANTADISRGMIIKLDGSLYTVVEFGENKTARAAAKVWAKLKGVDNSRSIEKTWNSGDTIFPVRVERKAYQFLYKDDTGYNFMDNETFDQITLSREWVGDLMLYMKEGTTGQVTFHDEKPLSLGPTEVRPAFCRPLLLLQSCGTLPGSPEVDDFRHVNE